MVAVEGDHRLRDRVVEPPALGDVRRGDRVLAADASRFPDAEIERSRQENAVLELRALGAHPAPALEDLLPYLDLCACHLGCVGGIDAVDVRADVGDAVQYADSLGAVGAGAALEVAAFVGDLEVLDLPPDPRDRLLEALGHVERLHDVGVFFCVLGDAASNRCGVHVGEHEAPRDLVDRVRGDRVERGPGAGGDVGVAGAVHHDVARDGEAARLVLDHDARDSLAFAYHVDHQRVQKQVGAGFLEHLHHDGLACLL